MQGTAQISTVTPAPLFWPISPDAWKVRSKSHPSAAHTVRRGREGLSCTCPAYRRCRHIQAIELELCEAGAQSWEPAKRDALGEPVDMPNFVADPDDDCGDLWGDEPEPVQETERPIPFDPFDPASRIYF